MNGFCIHAHLLEIVVCSLIILIDYPQSWTNANILGQGNLNFVSEKSGKSQGILLPIICGNPVKAGNHWPASETPFNVVSLACR